MFDKNLEDFVKSVGLSKVSEIVLNCPEGFDKYLKSDGTYIKRSKQLCYNSDEIDVDDLTNAQEKLNKKMNAIGRNYGNTDKLIYNKSIYEKNNNFFISFFCYFFSNKRCAVLMSLGCKNYMRWRNMVSKRLRHYLMKSNILSLTLILKLFL